MYISEELQLACNFEPSTWLLLGNSANHGIIIHHRCCFICGIFRSAVMFTYFAYWLCRDRDFGNSAKENTMEIVC